MYKSTELMKWESSKACERGGSGFCSCWEGKSWERLRDDCEEEEWRNCPLSLEVLCFGFVIEACLSRLVLIKGEGEIIGKSESEGTG